MNNVAILPIPVEFELPSAAWRRVDPQEYGVPTAAFMAVRPDPAESYTPVLTISGGFRTDPVMLEQIADESLDVLRDDVGNADLVKRRTVESDTVPAIMQVLEASATIDDKCYDLRQWQVVEALLDLDDPRKRIVLLFTMTCTYAQGERLAPEFEKFMASVVVLPDVD